MTYQPFNSSGFPSLSRRLAQEPHADDPKADAQERDRLYASGYPIARAVSKTLQSSLDLYNGSTWPLPELMSEEANVERRAENAEKIRKALKGCTNFGVSTHGASCKGEYLDSYLVRSYKVGGIFGKLGPQVSGSGINSSYDAGMDFSSAIPTAHEVPLNTEAKQDTSHVALETMNHETSGSVMESMCNAATIQVEPILSLTLEDTSTEMNTPAQAQQILLHHFEVGFDGVEAIIHGQARFHGAIAQAHLSWNSHVVAAGKNTCANHEQSLGLGDIDTRSGDQWWIFFGVQYKQPTHNANDDRKTRWLCFGLPKVAALFIGQDEEMVDVEIGGGRAGDGRLIETAVVAMRRTLLKLSRGGVAPIDIINGDEGWEEDLVQDMRAAMSTFSLRVSFLAEKEQ
ncbi:MAG: hypothetical protein Q9164_004049 [Protoblastenia rupestris]